jgi:hypothetical protein
MPEQQQKLLTASTLKVSISLHIVSFNEALQLMRESVGELTNYGVSCWHVASMRPCGNSLAYHYLRVCDLTHPWPFAVPASSYSSGTEHEKRSFSPAQLSLIPKWICPPCKPVYKPYKASVTFSLLPAKLVYSLAPWRSRQLVHRWRLDCQPYAPATLYPQEDSCYSLLLESESTPELECGWKN